MARYQQIKRIGFNRGNARIRFETPLLNEVGLTAGTTFFATYAKGELTLWPDDDGERVVAKGTKRGNAIPMIEICNSEALGILANEDEVLAVFDTDEQTVTVTKIPALGVALPKTQSPRAHVLHEGKKMIRPKTPALANCGRFVAERIEEWAYWICERERVRKAKESGKRPPWTSDPIIANNRFCNVRRMDDKVSKWMLESWFAKTYADRRTALIAGLLARMINKPETLAAITGGKPFTKWDYDRAYKAMYEIKETGTPVFTNAYIINGASGGPKIDQVLNAINDCYKTSNQTAAQYIVPSSMELTATNLSKLRGVGSFISGQVVADLRWVLGDIDDGWWQDRMSWAPPGPGSSRGMKYLLGVAAAADMAGRGNDMRPKEFLDALRELVALAQAHPAVGAVFRERQLEAHDIQNTLCETGKFIRVKYGEGRAKNGFDAQTSWHGQQEIDL